MYKEFNLKKVVDLKEMKVGEHVTHGDLVIYKIKEFPVDITTLKDVPLAVLAEGEFSGHAHQFHVDNEKIVRPAFELINDKFEESVYTLKKTEDGVIFLDLKTTLLLRHQEHFTFRFHPGKYDIDRQLERNPYDDILKKIAD